MRSRILQVKLAVDMIITVVICMSPEIPLNLKIGFALCMLDYSFLSSKRIEDEQSKEKDNETK